MYEARQNKEKVSRRIEIGGGARQRVQFDNINTAKKTLIADIIQKTPQDAENYWREKRGLIKEGGLRLDMITCLVDKNLRNKLLELWFKPGQVPLPYLILANRSPIVRPRSKEVTPKITEAGLPQFPGKIKKVEQPGDSPKDLSGSAVIGARVRRNLNYHNISAGDTIDLVENHTYLWVEKEDGTIIIGDEAGGLGHPTIALDLDTPQSTVGTTGRARIGGELKMQAGTIYIDNLSGRYGKGRVAPNLNLPREKMEYFFGMTVRATKAK